MDGFIPFCDRVGQGNGRVAGLGQRGDGHGIIGAMEHGFVVIAFCKEELGVLAPVDHGPHPVAGFQRLA